MKFQFFFLCWLTLCAVDCGVLRNLFPTLHFDSIRNTNLISPNRRTCSSPYGNKCIKISECRFFNDLLRNTPIPRPRSIVGVIEEHQCGSRDNVPLVCCFDRENRTEESSVPTVTTTARSYRPTPRLKRVSSNVTSYFSVLPEKIVNHKNYRLLPLDRCGPISLANRIVSGKKTVAEEFPWMALVVYDTPDVGIEFRCGGTVISEYYILTAAHCILNSTILGVRLGEYDLARTSEDCSSSSYCPPPVQDFYIKEAVVHPKYNAKTYENDVALLRASNVQPICLPVGELNDDLNGKLAIVTGWGVTEAGRKSSILLKASIPVLAITACKTIYDHYAPVTDKQLCAGGQSGVDSCAGDSGGPLIYAGLIDESPRFIQYGIVSYGPKECGTDGQPAVYTRVSAYLKWILDNMKDL